MLKSYFVFAWRNLVKDRQFTILNLLGLSIGLACTLLIYSWIQNERSVDKFNKNDERLFAVMKTSPNADGTIGMYGSTQGMLAQSMAAELPEVEFAVATREVDAGIVSAAEKHIRAKPEFVDKDFFNIFSYRILAGNAKTFFADPFKIMISDRLAQKLFKTTRNVIGRRIEWNGGHAFDGSYSVAGVFEAPPLNATNQFDFLFSLDLFRTKEAEDIAFWGSNSMFTYITLKKGTDPVTFNAKIKDFAKAKIKALYKGDDIYKWEGDLFIQRFSDRYLHNHFENGVQSGGRIEYVRLFSIIAVFILMIACINFMNLSTAKAAKRIKEVGIKKTMGATRLSLILQYLGESMLMAFSALLIASLMVMLALPSFKLLTGKEIDLQFDSGLIMTIICITIIVGFVAGSYPALYLSRFRPALVLKGNINAKAGESWIRKGLVVFQFAISIVLIISVMVVYQQMNLIQTTNLGYSRNQIIRFSDEGKLRNAAEPFLEQLKAIPGVVNASYMDGDMVGRYSQGGSGISWEGKGPKEGIEFKGLDVHYGMMELLDMKMKEGRMFSKEYGTDTSAIIFNETAIAAMKLKDPIGKVVGVWSEKRRIIGIVKDFHAESMYNKVMPYFLRLSRYSSNIYVKIKAGQERATIARIEKIYSQYNQGLTLEYHFLDEDYQALYSSEQRVSLLSRWFAAIAVIISCLGLFGLSAFTAQKRQKEIGIRKVVGASVTGLVGLLSSDFLKLTLIAILIAFPLSWWAMHAWLQSFAYRVKIEPVIFGIAALVTLVITVLTISYQSIKAARANPVKSLRSE